MKIIKHIMILLLVMLIILTNQTVWALGKNMKAQTESNKILSVWHIDTNLEQVFYKENGIHIEGWKLATEANSKIVISIDGKEISEDFITYSYKYDLISIVGGYGTYKENPTPNFDINIPKEQITEGIHTLKMELKTADEMTVLQSIEKKIEVTRNIKHAMHIDTKFNETTFGKNGIEIKGWKLATEADTKIIAKIDGNIIENTKTDMYYAYDLISIVGGYGTYKENPTPNFTIKIPTKGISNGKHKLEIQFATSDGIVLEKINNDIIVDKTVKHAMHIDTNLNSAIFNKTGIEIKGWKLATEADTKIIAKIDGNIIEDTKIDMYYAYDLISIIGGYGTYKENPTPNFTIKIPSNNLKGGKHILSIQFMTSNNELLEEVKKEITIDTSIKHAMHIDTNMEEQSWKPNGIKISGWKLATEANTKLVIYVGNRKIENVKIDEYYAYDLISIVGGYGTYKENPTPNFTINIPVTEFKEDDDTLKLQMVTENDDILEERIYKIVENKTRIHVETPYDRTTITNSKHNISGWVMTTEQNVKVRILIDGHYMEENAVRTDRKDVLNAIKNYGDEITNPLPGFELGIDFSKFDLGLHQIAIRVEKENGKIIGEHVMYIWLRRSITYEQGIYGESGLLKSGNPYGSKLEYYRYGDGPNVLFTTFTVHGFEDNWAHDGEALVYIANKFYEDLKENHDANYALADEWTIYILPEVNPDGRRHGTTNNGPGRTTLYSQAPNNKGIDLNRCWKTSGFVANETSRNYAGTAPFQAYEAQALRDFMQSHKSQNGQTILVDLHGWLQQLVGNREVGMYYAVQFPENHGRSLDRYGDGYMIGWARTALASNGRLAKASLVELPQNVHSMQDVKNQRLAERYIHATLSMLNGII